MFVLCLAVHEVSMSQVMMNIQFTNEEYADIDFPDNSVMGLHREQLKNAGNGFLSLLKHSSIQQYTSVVMRQGQCWTPHSISSWPCT